MNYFLTDYLGSLGTVRLGMVPSSQITQMHFWYISLLLLFFILFAVICRIIYGRQDTSADKSRIRDAASASTPSILKGFVFLITLPPSYGMSRLVSRFPRITTGVLVGLFLLAAVGIR